MTIKAVLDETKTPTQLTVTSDKRNIGTVTIAGETVTLRYDTFTFNTGALKATKTSDDGTTATFTLA